MVLLLLLPATHALVHKADDTQDGWQLDTNGLIFMATLTLAVSLGATRLAEVGADVRATSIIYGLWAATFALAIWWLTRLIKSSHTPRFRETPREDLVRTEARV